MESGERFSIHKRLISFKYAWRGIQRLIREEHNARIHLLATLLVVAMGFVFKVSLSEWCLITIVIVLVFAAEAFNSAIEALADKIEPKKDDLIAKAKDISSAGVLITAIGAAITGLLIFIPKIISYCQGG